MSLIRLDQANKVQYNGDNKRKEDLRVFCKYIGAKTKEERDKISKERKILMELNKTVNEYLEGTSLKREDFLWEKNTIEAYYDTGFRNGEKKGEKCGERNGIIKTAKNFLKMGVNTPEQIATATGLPIQEIEHLKNELDS